ncbi:hypothetical protein M758_UG344100 [Ceratodon purpureus]|nr:hypothetical protein M758_UG344100 [Ceratodon purpureus]KAG0597496.1 hypothetical protein M758_UG344100 [Ceratodon purpureus]
MLFRVCVPVVLMLSSLCLLQKLRNGGLHINPWRVLQLHLPVSCCLIWCHRRRACSPLYWT